MSLFNAKTLRYLLVCVFSWSLTGAAHASVTGSGAVESYTFNGSRNRQYKVYIPQSYDGNTAVPMIFALHGCAMDHDDALDLWNFDLIADQNNVIVVFPFVTSFVEQRSENCWGYWFDQHVQEGGNGEVDDLFGMGQEVEGRYNIDPNRRYITGISSGGGMVVAAAIAYNDYWAAAAPVAGVPYGDTSTSILTDNFSNLQFYVDKINAELNFDRAVPTLAIQSENDTTVIPQAMNLIRDSQLTVWGPDLTQDGPAVDCSNEGIDCTIRNYNDADGNVLVRTMLYDGLPAQSASLGQGHYWPGDDENQAKWAKEQGTSASQAIWEFFEPITLQGVQVCPDPNDTTAPATPTGLATVEVRDRYAVLSVNQNSETDFKSYNIYVNGGLSGSSTTNNVTVSGLNPETSYSVKVSAVDLCGNESGQSNAVSFTTTELEYVAPSETDTANGHFLAGRIDNNELLAYGSEYGYVDPFTLWQLEDGSWTDENPNVTPPTPTPTATPNPTPTPTPTATPEPTPTPTPTATPEPTPTPTPTPTPDPTCEEVSTFNYYHKTGGRAYSTGSFFSPDYFANGSDESMPGSTWGSNTLHSFDGATWHVGGC